jgi:hypothetical protein
MGYDIGEHRHRFAVWAAARAAQRGFTTVAHLRAALENCGVRVFLQAHNSESVDEATFDGHHRDWCRAILAWLANAGVRNPTYGRAAKLVGVYLKSVVVLAGKEESPLGRVAHPPIDSILLTYMARSSAIVSDKKAGWARIRWTALDEGGYYVLIRELRSVLAPGQPFWLLERYWTVTDEESVGDE